MIEQQPDQPTEIIQNIRGTSNAAFQIGLHLKIFTSSGQLLDYLTLKAQ